MSKIFNRDFLVCILIATILTYVTLNETIHLNIINNTNRIDILNNGGNDNTFDVENIKVGSDIKYDKPGWFNNPHWAKDGGIGIVVQMPTDFFDKTRDFTITAVNDGNAWISLKGPYNNQAGKIQPIYITYKSLKINGEEQLSEPVTVWHNQDKKIYFNVKDGDKYNINITYSKGNILPEILSIRTFLLFLCFIVLTTILLPQNFNKYLSIDLEQVIIKKWTQISLLSKKTFFWVFLITNLVFLFHTVTFFIGNHDWPLIKYGMKTYNMLWCGRFTGGLIQQIFGGDILPIINNLFCFAGFSFAMIYLVKYWKVPQNILMYVLLSLFIILMPFTLPWLYYTKQTTLFWNIFMVIYALYISEQHKWYKNLIAISLMVISLGAYASIISTIGIVFLGRCFIEYVYENKGVLNLLKTYKTTIINIIISIIVFKLILVYYDSIGALKHGDYNTDYITLSDIPQKLKTALVTIQEIFYVSHYYMGINYKILISIPLILTFIIIQQKKKIILGTIGIFVILLISQFTYIMAKSNMAHEVRIDFFSLPYIWALGCVMCIKAGLTMKNIAIIVMTSSIFYSTISDIRYQKINYLGYRAEMKIFDDIINRINKNENIQRNKEYTLVTIGKNTKRNIFYNNSNSKVFDGALLGFTVAAPSQEESFYNFNGQLPKINNGIAIPYGKYPTDISILKSISNFILNKAEAYPAKNSVYVDDKYIYVVYNENALKQVKDNLRKLLSEKGLL